MTIASTHAPPPGRWPIIDRITGIINLAITVGLLVLALRYDIDFSRFTTEHREHQVVSVAALETIRDAVVVHGDKLDRIGEAADLHNARTHELNNLLIAYVKAEREGRVADRKIIGGKIEALMKQAARSSPVTQSGYRPVVRWDEGVPVFAPGENR